MNAVPALCICIFLQHLTENGEFLPRDATQNAVLLRQFVRPSVTLRRDRISWNTLKIISCLISLCRHQRHRSTPNETPRKFGRNMGVV